MRRGRLRIAPTDAPPAPYEKSAGRHQELTEVRPAGKYPRAEKYSKLPRIECEAAGRSDAHIIGDSLRRILPPAPRASRGCPPIPGSCPYCVLRPPSAVRPEVERGISASRPKRRLRFSNRKSAGFSFVAVRNDPKTASW